MKTVSEIRESFWEAFPEFAGDRRKTYRQSRYNATIRSAFVEYVDSLERDGTITSKLAERAAL